MKRLLIAVLMLCGCGWAFAQGRALSVNASTEISSALQTNFFAANSNLLNGAVNKSAISQTNAVLVDPAGVITSPTNVFAANSNLLNGAVKSPDVTLTNAVIVGGGGTLTSPTNFFAVNSNLLNGAVGVTPPAGQMLFYGTTQGVLTNASTNLFAANSNLMAKSAALPSARMLTNSIIPWSWYDDFERGDSAQRVLGSATTGQPWQLFYPISQGSHVAISDGRLRPLPTGSSEVPVTSYVGGRMGNGAVVRTIGGVVSWEATDDAGSYSTATFIIAGDTNASAKSWALHAGVDRWYLYCGWVTDGGVLGGWTKALPAALATNTPYYIEFAFDSLGVSAQVAGATFRLSSTNHWYWLTNTAQLYCMWEHYSSDWANSVDLVRFDSVFASGTGTGPTFTAGDNIAFTLSTNDNIPITLNSYVTGPITNLTTRGSNTLSPTTITGLVVRPQYAPSVSVYEAGTTTENAFTLISDPTEWWLSVANEAGGRKFSLTERHYQTTAFTAYTNGMLEFPESNRFTGPLVSVGGAEFQTATVTNLTGGNITTFGTNKLSSTTITNLTARGTAPQATLIPPDTSTEAAIEFLSGVNDFRLYMDTELYGYRFGLVDRHWGRTGFWFETNGQFTLPSPTVVSNSLNVTGSVGVMGTNNSVPGFLSSLKVTDPPFNADPTGINDATAAIQAAIDYAGGVSIKCRVFVPHGRFKITGTLELVSGVIIEGESAGTTGGGTDLGTTQLRKTTAGDIFHGPAFTEYWWIKNIYFYGPGSGSTDIKCINLGPTNTHFRVSNCRAWGFTGGTGFQATNSWTGLLDNNTWTTMKNGIVLDSKVNGLAILGGDINNCSQYGLYADDCNSIVVSAGIQNCLFAAFLTNECEAVSFDGAYIESNDARDLLANGAHSVSLLNSYVASDSITNIEFQACKFPRVEGVAFGYTTPMILVSSDTRGFTQRANSCRYGTLTIYDNSQTSYSSPMTANPHTLFRENCWDGKALFYGPTSAGEIDLPVGKTGMDVRIYEATNYQITIDPNGSEVIVRDGTAQTGGVSIILSAGVGNYVRLINDGAKWITLEYKGTLTQGS